MGSDNETNKTQSKDIFKPKALRGKKAKMFEAMKSQLGIITTACKQAGIGRATHYRWLEEDENYRYWMGEVPDIALDIAENALLKKITEGSSTDIQFFLKSKGKRRGYFEKQEIDHTGKIPLTINLIEKSVEEIKDGKLNNQPEAKGNAEGPGKQGTY